MYSFHVDVPAGVTEVEASFDLISADSAGGGGPAASSNLLDLNWNQVVLYPQGQASDAVQVLASVRLPEGWKYGTALTPALTTAHAARNEIDFDPVSLTTLVDSPLIAGVHYKQIELVPAGEMPAHYLDMVGDSEEAIAISPADISAYRKLVAEADALFGAHHYRQYHFLYTLSDRWATMGSSTTSRATTQPPTAPCSIPSTAYARRRVASARIRPFLEWQVSTARGTGHEELSGTDDRRPALGLRRTYRVSRRRAATAARVCGRPSSTAKRWRERRPRSTIARAAPGGRSRTRPFRADAAHDWLAMAELAAQPGLLSRGRTDLAGSRFIIRQQTHGQRSLDDFCRRFHGGESGPSRKSSRTRSTM